MDTTKITSSTQTPQLPSIKTWLNNSWELFKITWLGVAKIYLFSIITSLITFIVIAITLLLPVLPSLKQAMQSQDLQPLIAALSNNPLLLVGSIITVIILGLGYQLIINILLITFIDSKDRNIKIKINYWKKVKSRLVPLVLLSILSLIIMIGSLFVLIIPFIIISVLFTFTIYELILEDKSSIQSIKNSIRIIGQNFSDFIARYLLIIFASFALSLIPQDSNIFSQSLNIVIAVASMLLTPSVTFVLYKQLRAHTDIKKRQPLTWIWVITTIGWALALIISILASKTLYKTIQQSNKINPKSSIINKSKNTPFATDSSKLLDIKFNQ